jgi:hypothetical protein
MSGFPKQVCDVCGASKVKQASWFVATPDDTGESLQISPWNEAFGSRQENWTLCGPSHVQEFVRAWLAASNSMAAVMNGSTHGDFALTSKQETQMESQLLESQTFDSHPDGQINESMLPNVKINGSSLSSEFVQDRESAMLMLDAFEAVIESYICQSEFGSPGLSAPTFDSNYDQRPPFDA